MGKRRPTATANFWTHHDERNALSDADAYRRYIALVSRELLRYFDEGISPRAYLKRGFTPQVTLTGCDGSIASVAITDKLARFLHRPEALPCPLTIAYDVYLQRYVAAIRPSPYRDDLCVLGARKTVAPRATRPTAMPLYRESRSANSRRSS